MKFAGATDVGKQRSNNQDSYATGELPNGAGWAVVCDGMGGANGGNIASYTAVKTISEQISLSWRNEMPPISIRNLLQSAVAAANINVFDLAQTDTSLEGMGTTVVAVIVSKKVAYIAHAGDSRAYLVSGGNLSQITTDHSVVQNMIEQGKITEEEAKNHPNRNVITKALGVDENLEPEFTEIELENNDYILICTDGLIGYAEHEDIENTLRSSDYYQCPQALVDLANKNGGGDNITVVTIAENDND